MSFGKKLTTLYPSDDRDDWLIGSDCGLNMQTNSHARLHVKGQYRVIWLAYIEEVLFFPLPAHHRTQREVTVHSGKRVDNLYFQIIAFY